MFGIYSLFIKDSIQSRHSQRSIKRRYKGFQIHGLSLIRVSGRAVTITYLYYFRPLEAIKPITSSKKSKQISPTFKLNAQCSTWRHDSSQADTTLKLVFRCPALPALSCSWARQACLQGQFVNFSAILQPPQTFHPLQYCAHSR